MKEMHGQIRVWALVALALALSACPAPRRPAPALPPVTMPAGAPTFPGAVPFRVVADESLVRILVFRGGTLSSAGHNHVIASRNLSGTVWVHEDLTRSGFQIVMPVTLLEVDDPQSRSQEGPDFAHEVPQSAREGTRKNMLAVALLDGDRFPGITLTSLQTRGTRENMQVRTRIEVKDQAREVTVPVTAQYEGDRVIASGEFKVKQSELGLTPFSVMLGALQVQDELDVKFRIVATKRE